jgi:HEAT repeat protein
VPSEAQRAATENILRRLPRRVLNRVASDASLPAGAAAIFSSHILERRSVEHLLRDAAMRKRGLGKWRRISALRVLAHAFREGTFDERIFDLLRDAAHDHDRDVADAAVVILGNMHDKRAARVLVETLRNGGSIQSRIAAQLDDFPSDKSELLLSLLDDPNPSTRRWAATLLARYNDHTQVPQRLAELADDEDANVRSAVVTSLGYLAAPPSRMRRPVHIPREELRKRGDLVAQVAQRLTGDESWFVRAQAARTLGELKRPELADAIIPLLSDSQWWVRQAAKDALLAIGSEAAPSIVEALESSDKFARNSAAEVLQNMGFINLVVRRLMQPQADAADMHLVQKIYQASGETMLHAALSALPETHQSNLWRIIRKAPDSGETDNQSAEITNGAGPNRSNAETVFSESVSGVVSNNGNCQLIMKG